MTPSEKKKLDENMEHFKSFFDFHAYAYENEIEFDNDEWVEYSAKLKQKILNEKDPSEIYIDTTGLILPTNTG